MSVARDSLRLLILAPFAPRLDAPHGGGKAIAGLVCALGERHRVALLCLRPRDDPSCDAVVRERCELVEEFELPGVGRTFLLRWQRKARLLAGLASGRPMWVSDTDVATLAARVRQLAHDWAPDVIQAEYHVMAQYFRQERGVPRVLTEIEPGADAAADTQRSARGIVRLLLRADLRAWRRFEQRALTEADAVVAYTERDRRALLALEPEAHVSQIPMGFDVRGSPLSAAGSEPESYLFAGNFMHPPNIEAARRLVCEIGPRVASKRPDAKLYIVGDRAPSSVRRMAKENVVVTGFVEAVDPYLDRAAVVVVPLRSGGGQRVKVMEALAAGKALVASPLAVEGLDLADGEEVVIAETDEEFASAVVDLLGDERRRCALARKARDWAEANLGWGRVVAAYEELYAEVSRGRRRSRT